MSTIPSRSISLWRRLYTRFALEPGPATVSPDVSKTIIPVTQADLLLVTPEVRLYVFTSVNNTVVTAVTVPDQERWELYAYDLFSAGGSRQADQVRIDEGAAPEVTFQTFTLGTGDIWRADQPFLLEAGWRLRVRFGDVGVGDGDWHMALLLRVEALF